MTTPRRRVRVLTALGVTALAVVGLAAAPAGADPAAGEVVTRHVDASGVVSPVGASKATPSTSRAGYRVPTVGDTQRLRATVTVPDVDCSSTRRAFAVVSTGLFGTGSTDSTPDLVIAALDVTCSGSEAYRYGVVVGTSTVFVAAVVRVRPGDVITMVVTASPTASSAAVLDAAGRRLTGATDTGFRPTSGSAGVQNGFGDDGTARLPLPPVTFTGVIADGAPVVRAAPVRIVQHSLDGSVFAVPSAFTPDGAGFTVRRVRG